MNKQPFYHCGYMQGKRTAVVKAIKGIKTVLKDTVEYEKDELLFTATSDVSTVSNERLKKIPGLKIDSEVDAEAGDPADLM